VTYGHVKLPNTYYSGLDAGRSVGHSYRVKSGIIQAIDVFVSEPTSLFTPVSILNTYGMPEEIYLRTWQGGTGYWMTFFYPQSGFRILYIVPGGTNENGVISACSQEEFPYLTIWSPERELSFIETYALFGDEADSEYQIPLKAAAGMDVPTFYEMFRNPDVPICLETPTDIWPGY
jgi:hypothetical protein